MSETPSTLSPQEHQLLQGIRAGDESAYRALFAQYYPTLVVFALRYVADTDQARERVQEVFVKLYQNRESLLVTVFKVLLI